MTQKRVESLDVVGALLYLVGHRRIIGGDRFFAAIYAARGIAPVIEEVLSNDPVKRRACIQGALAILDLHLGLVKHEIVSGTDHYILEQKGRADLLELCFAGLTSKQVEELSHAAAHIARMCGLEELDLGKKIRGGWFLTKGKNDNGGLMLAQEALAQYQLYCHELGVDPKSVERPQVQRKK